MGASAELVEELVAAVGRAQLAAGYPVGEVDETLRAVAAAYGCPGLQVYVLPNAVFVGGESGGGGARVVTSEGVSLRLDQAAEVHRVVRLVEVGAVDVRLALERVDAVYGLPPRFPVWVSVLANGLSAAGFALVFRISLWGVLIAGVLGVLVGLALVLCSGRRSVLALVPFFSAVVASFVVFSLSGVFGEAVQPVRAVAAPIITLIPGVALTRGAQELAGGQVVSGSARLVGALLQILVLAFGVLVGAQLAPVQSVTLADLTEVLLPWWAAWVGVLVFAVGQSLVSNEARGGVRLVVLLLLVAFGVQSLLSLTVDVALAAGVAAGVSLFLAVVFQRRLRRAVPAFALFEPVFWLLVPGSLGLVALTESLGGVSSFASVASSPGDVVFAAVASVVAITLGMIVAGALGRLVPSRGVVSG